MITNNRRKITGILGILLCLIMCIPNVAVFADDPTDRTGDAFFNVRTLILRPDSTESKQVIIENGVSEWDEGNDSLNLSSGISFLLEAAWGSNGATADWEVGDYMIFDLPLTDILNYPTTSAQGGSGSLNAGYGTYEIISGGTQVKITMAAPGVTGAPLENGRFEVYATVKYLGESTVEDSTDITQIDKNVKWRYTHSSGTEYGINPDKDIEKSVSSQNNGTDAVYTLTINGKQAAEYYRAVANYGKPGTQYDGGSPDNYSTKRENVMIIDEIPFGAEFANDSTGTLRMVLRGPYTSEATGIVRQSGSDYIRIDISGARISHDGESYNDFVQKVKNAPAPCFGMYKGADKQVVVVNAGNFPSDESFLSIYNRLTSGEDYTSIEALLEDYFEKDPSAWDNRGGDLYPNKEARLAAWMETGFYSDAMSVWSYNFSYTLKAAWTGIDVENNKTILNTATMSYDGLSEPHSHEQSFNFKRSYASVELGSGEIYLTKMDADTFEPIVGVQFKIEEYTGNAETLEGVIADKDNSAFWEEVHNNTTTSGGILRYQGTVEKYYRVTEIASVGDYDVNSFELYEKDGNNLGAKYEHGIFKTPGTGGIYVFATNSETAVTPATISLGLTKVLTGRDMTSGEFEFKLYEGTETSGTIIDTQTNAAATAVSGTATDTITFDTSSISYSAAGSHTYTVVETKGSADGVTYDETIFTVTVNVMEVGGELTATASYSSSASGAVPGITFTNTYAPTPVNVSLTATKVLTGRNLAATDFKFNLYRGDTTDGAAFMASVFSDADGDIVFSNIETTPYTAVTPAGSPHVYTIAEAIPAVEERLPGVDYDENTFTAKVTVTDAGGQLVTSVEYFDKDGTKLEGGIVFNNEFIPEPIEYVPTATKDLTGGRMLTAGEFKFEVRKDGVKVSEGANLQGGTIVFDAIEYDISDVGTHNYTVVEIEGDVTQIDYDPTVFTFSVEVSFDADTGLLSAVQAYPAPIVFKNHYTPDPISVELTAKKVLLGRYLQGSEFTFRLSEDGILLGTAKNDVNGNITFPEMIYDEAHIGGTFTYVVTEVIGYDPTIAYDRTQFTVVVAISQNPDGTLKATVTYPVADGITFTNTYVPPPPTTETTKPGDTTTAPVTTVPGTTAVVTTTPGTTVPVTTKPADTTPGDTKPEVTTAPEVTTGPEETVITNTPEVPQYPRSEFPDANDPNSPEFFVLMENGIPLGTYKKVQQPDGSWIYVELDDTPLGWITPATGDEVVKLVIAILLSASLIGMIAFLTYMKKVRGKKAKR